MAVTPGAGAPQPTAAAQAADDVAGDGLSTVAKLLAAIGGGIGVLGFVAFLGAAILWVRMDEAGMPANEAVAVIPKSVLLTTGASFLVPAILIGLAFIGILYLSEWLLQWIANRELRRLEAEVEQNRMKSEAAEKARTNAAQKAREIIAHQQDLAAISADVIQTPSIDNEAAGNFAPSEQVTETIIQLGEEANPSAQPDSASDPESLPPPEVELIANERTLEEAVADAKARDTHRRGTFRPIVMFLLLLALGCYIYSKVQLPDYQLLLLGVLAIALACICLAVLSQTNFVWFGLAAFLTVWLLAGALTYLRTLDESKVEPVAVLRSDGTPLYGFFIAQTSDRIYLGTTLPRGAFRLDSIPREEVTDLTIGPLMATDEASDYGRQLAVQACTLARRRPAAAIPAGTGAKQGEDAPTKEPCSQADLDRLHGEAAEDADGSESRHAL